VALLSKVDGRAEQTYKSGHRRLGTGGDALTTNRETARLMADPKQGTAADFLQRLSPRDRKVLVNAISKLASPGECDAAVHHAGRVLAKVGANFTDLALRITAPASSKVDGGAAPPSKVDDLYAANVRIDRLERELRQAQKTARPTIAEDIARFTDDAKPVRVRHRDIAERMVRAFAEQDAANLSVRQLAALCGVSVQTAANWKKGMSLKPRR
jgi:hypothetical protein